MKMTHTKPNILMKTGIEIIAEERLRQVEEEGWTFAHDKQYVEEQLAKAAGCYAMPHLERYYSADDIPLSWPWNSLWWKPTPDDRIRELAKAGALIAAEIDRIQSGEE